MNPKIEAARTWVTDTGWPAVTGWYRGSEIVRHVVTFLVGLAIGLIL